jgi:hypothetical protein
MSYAAVSASGTAESKPGAAMGSKRTIPMTLLLVVLGVYAAAPRNADLRKFDPADVARLETAMWRDYYAKHYLMLFYHLYESSRTFDFSPLARFRIALAAAQAARAFQPTRSRSEAERAIPFLIAYYGLLREAAPVAIDPRELASRELDWWQARRESVAPRDYGITIAQVAALTYGERQDGPALLAFGIDRAEAMSYRDAHGQTITEQDWLKIEAQLRNAYQQLKMGIGNR